jgi:hypothetical protein
MIEPMFHVTSCDPVLPLIKLGHAYIILHPICFLVKSNVLLDSSLFGADVLIVIVDLHLGAWMGSRFFFSTGQ